MAFHNHNFWEPFGDDAEANRAAHDAITIASKLASERKRYEAIPAGNHAAEAAQRPFVEDLAGELDGLADRGGIERDLFRQTLARRLRACGVRDPQLEPLEPTAFTVDEARRKLEGERLDAKGAMEDAAKRYASAKRIHGERQQAFLAADRALRAYDKAKAGRV